jgi:meso-butanediol dehydrogenase/(S,S)-butanediol dehydrogenase/diacetyl reductase
MSALAGVRAIVTGAGRGLGFGVARGLARRGAAIALLDVDQSAAAETLAEMQGEGANGVAVTVDVTDEDQVRDAVATVTHELGGIDLLVNNAGVLSVYPLVQLPLSEWRRVMEVNMTGTFLMSREVVRVMLAAGRPGSIVSIASIAGKRGDPQLTHYSASKAAVIGFTQALARELAGNNVTVNAVCPGLVETDMINALAKAWSTTVEAMIQTQAIGRPQTPDEIAEAVAFLHRNRSVTGQALNVDGGTIFD